MAKSETVQGVIDVLVDNRRRFQAFCYSLTPEQLDRDVPDSTWVVRDFVSHLGTLDTAFLNWFSALAQSGTSLDSSTAPDGRPFDVDAFNDAQVASRRTWPLDQVFAEAEANRARLIESMQGLTDEQIDRPMHFAADAKRPAADLPLKLFMAGWAHHDPIHVADMIKALPECADDGEITAWLDNPFVRGYQAAMSGQPRGHGAND